LEELLKDRIGLEDYNINLRLLDEARGISLERPSTLIDDNLAQTARATADTLPARSSPILSYLANSISSGEHSIPYSLVTGLDEVSLKALPENGQVVSTGSSNLPPIILNDWAARD